MTETSNALASFVDNIAARAERHACREDEYTGEDGLLHCKKCDGRRETVINIFGQERVVRCVCKCTRDEEEARKAIQRKEAQERRRRICFQGTNMAGWSFENDDRQRPELSDAMAKYAENFTEYIKTGQGLLLYGPKGTGKTYLAACIANRVIDLGHRAYMTNFSQAVNNLQATFEKQEYKDDLCSYDLLIIDDLGTERKSEFMQEQVFNIIDARYRSGLPLIVTSNLTSDELGKPGTIEAGRIYDRILERCLPVKVEGESRRRQAAKTSWEHMRAQLGMEAARK